MQRVQDGCVPPSSLAHHLFLNYSFFSKLLILRKMTPGFCEPPSKSPNIRWGGEDSGVRAGRQKYGHFLGLTHSI